MQKRKITPRITREDFHKIRLPAYPIKQAAYAFYSSCLGTSFSKWACNACSSGRIYPLRCMEYFTPTIGIMEGGLFDKIHSSSKQGR